MGELFYLRGLELPGRHFVLEQQVDFAEGSGSVSVLATLLPTSRM
jgi:hypothetical protein